MSPKDKVIARICSGLFARFRKMPGRLTAEDLRNMKISFSQHGEDLVILEHLQGMQQARKGIYVDAGCFDPVMFSNTRLLHLYGWRGINIDAAADVIRKFDTHRPSDLNVCAALSDTERSAYLEGDEGSAMRKIAETTSGPEANSVIAVQTTTISKVIDSSPFIGRSIDFLDIDCEGHDLCVLKGFPFEKSRPKLVAVEGHSAKEADLLAHFLSDLGYFKICVRGPTHLFRARETVAASLPHGARLSEYLDASGYTRL